MKFALSAEPIDPTSLASALEGRSGAGALVAFEGRVRDINQGRPVTLLEYEAAPALAEKEGRRILEETAARFAVIDAHCVHRTGSLKVGEIAVWAGVVAGHRGAAFDACRHIIEELKVRVPIWKKEHYRDGSTEWLDGAGKGR